MTIIETNSSLVTKIKEALHERFGLDPNQLDENSRLGDLGVDSLHVVEIMMDLEADLGVKFEDLTVPTNPSLGEVATAIARNFGPKP